MKKEIKLWELLTALIPITLGVTGWLWHVATVVAEDRVRINNLERSQDNMQLESKTFQKEILNKLETILIKIENKQDRK